MYMKVAEVVKSGAIGKILSTTMVSLVHLA